MLVMSKKVVVLKAAKVAQDSGDLQEWRPICTEIKPLQWSSFRVTERFQPAIGCLCNVETAFLATGCHGAAKKIPGPFQLKRPGMSIDLRGFTPIFHIPPGGTLLWI